MSLIGTSHSGRYSPANQTSVEGPPGQVVYIRLAESVCGVSVICLLLALDISQPDTSLQILYAQRAAMITPESDLRVLVREELITSVMMSAGHVAKSGTKCILERGREGTNQSKTPVPDAIGQAVHQRCFEHLEQCVQSELLPPQYRPLYNLPF